MSLHEALNDARVCFSAVHSEDESSALAVDLLVAKARDMLLYGQEGEELCRRLHVACCESATQKWLSEKRPLEDIPSNQAAEKLRDLLTSRGLTL